MQLNTIFEIIGYAGSALVIISMLMTSVIKLRVINTIGSVIFCAYALCIHSYPTAAMQVCLIIINVVSLYKLLAVKKEYSIIKAGADDSYVRYFLDTYSADMKKFFPEQTECNSRDLYFLVCCNTNPAGIFIAEAAENNSLNAKIDYTTPRYRDGSAGKFLYEFLGTLGFKNVTAQSGCTAHVEYLKKMGFKLQGETYKKDL